MVTTIDIAQYIYNKRGWMDAWKLAKLTYYVQAWHLGWVGKPLAEDEFQAWKDGSVAPKLHAENRHARSSILSTDLPAADVERISRVGAAVLEAVLAFYGNMSKEQLIELTHAEQPWIEARADLLADEPSNSRISESTMRRFYARQEMRGVPGPERPAIQEELLPNETHEQILKAVKRWDTARQMLAD